MKTDTTKFKEALDVLEISIANRVVQPELKNVNLGKFLLTTDLDTFTLANIQTDLNAAVPLKLLKSSLEGYNERELEITGGTEESEDGVIRFERDDFGVELLTGNFLEYLRYSFETTLPNTITFDGYELYQTINALSTGVAPYEQTNVLGGIFMGISGKGVDFAATDGSKLITKTLKLKHYESKPRNLVIPANWLKRTIKAFHDSEDTYLSFGDVKMQYSCNDSDMEIILDYDIYRSFIRRIDGNYPRYKQLIPPTAKAAYHYSMNRWDLARGIKKLLPLVNERTDVIKLHFNMEGQLEALAQSPQGKARIKIPFINYKDSMPMKTAINAKFLLQILQNMDSGDDVHWYTNGNLSPIVLKENQRQGGMTQLVMPIQVDHWNGWKN